MPRITIRINGSEHSVREGVTILEACQAAGIRIPVLCHHPGLETSGDCRLCVVEVEGWKTLQPSCVTPVTPNMVVRTDTPRVETARRILFELLLAAHDRDSLACEAACGDELRKLAREYGLDSRSRFFKGG